MMRRTLMAELSSAVLLTAQSALTMTAVLLAIMATLMVANQASAQGRTLWTTQEDFAVVPSGNAGWNAGNAGEQTLAPVATPDSDGSSTNGVANYTAPGAAGTAGAESVQWGTGTFNYMYGPDLAANTSLQKYMGTQGIIKFDYTIPQIHVGTYFHLGAVFNYDTSPYASFYFNNLFGTETASPNANGYYTTTIPYTGFLNTTAKDYFQIGVIFNSNYSPLDPYYVDNFHLIGHGDFNEDGHVDARDIAAMESALTNPTGYETTYGLTAGQLATLGDFNADGNFTNGDLQGFLNYLIAGNGSVTTVPEPGSLLLLGLAMPGFVIVARRFGKKSTI
jgi:hypothetical protein